MDAVIAALLEHIDNGTGQPVCGATQYEPNLLVEAAMASDCERCRSVLMLGNLKDHPKRKASTWEPEPMPDADAMMRRRD